MRVRLDPVGMVLISTASLCLIYPLVQGRELGWPLWIFGLMAPASRCSACSRSPSAARTGRR